MRLVVLVTLGFILALVSAQTRQVIYNSKDFNRITSPGGTTCGHSRTYDLQGTSRGPIFIAFPLDSLSGPVPASFVSSAKFYIKPTRCVNADKLYINARAISDTNATIDEENFSRGNCPSLASNQPNFDIQIDNECNSQPLDVTAQLNANLAAGTNQLIISVTDSTRGNPNGTTLAELNFCSPFLNPIGEENQYSSNSNCGVFVESREFSPSSFVLVINGDLEQSTTSAPTSESTTSAPTQTTTVVPISTTFVPTSTASPTTSAPTSATCAGVDVSGPNVASPAKRTVQPCSGNGYCDGGRCICNAGFNGVDCQNADTTTGTPTENISGDNNARADNAATKIIAVSGIIVALLIVLML